MRRFAGAVITAVAVALWPAVAAAHPIEPLVTDSPMPVPEDQIGVDSTYRALRGGDDHTEQGIDMVISAGIGSRAELSVAGTFDATEGTIGPVAVGAKILLFMEDHASVDLALAGRVTSAQTAEGALLAGRSLIPGLYLQGKLAVLGSSADPADELPAAKPHAGGVEVAGRSVSFQGAAALQWSPAPRFLPTLEVSLTHSFADDADGRDEVWLVPEMMFLVDMNHLSVKLGVPVGVAGELEIGVIAALDWQG